MRSSLPVTVFISGTFRDLHAERDQLALVFPAVEERLAQSGHAVALEPIDLRFGVETKSEAEAEAKELLVLKVCLAEIERSRPFLVAILGDRYGWTPSDDRLRAAAQEAGFDEESALGKSVTALEIDFGIVERDGAASRVRFYLRKPLDYDAMPPEARAKYSDAYAGDVLRAERIRGLKEWLATRFPDRVHWYEAHWDDGSGRLTGLDAFSEQVIRDLAADLEAEVPADPPPATWQDAERRALVEFVEHRTRGFVGRRDTLAELQRFAARGEGTGIVLTGPTGSGKSAVFGRLVQSLRKEESVVLLAHGPGMSARSTQVEWMVRRWVEELARAGGGDQKEVVTDESAWEVVDQAFQVLLRRVAASKRVVLLVDALDQFDKTLMSQHVTWLPKELPENVRLIATGLPTTPVATLLGRKGFTSRDLPALTPADGRTIVEQVLDRYHRTLGDRVIGALLTKEVSPGVPSCGNPLWLVTATEELNLLDEDDFAQMDAAPLEADVEERIERLLVSVAASFPPDVAGLYDAMAARLEGLHGRRGVAGFAAALAVSRFGWRERDLLVLVHDVGALLAPDAPEKPLDALRLAHLRRGFRAHLVRRGAEGTWDFFHRQMRDAVTQRYLRSAPVLRSVHGIVAKHLLNQPADDPLRVTEATFHLLRTDDSRLVAEHLGGDLTNAARASAGRAIADFVAEDPSDRRIAWVGALSAAPDLERQVAVTCARRLLFDAIDALAVHGTVSHRASLARAIVAQFAHLVSTAPDDDETARFHAVANERLGDALRLQGDATGALNSYMATANQLERLRSRHPGDGNLQHDAAIANERIGSLKAVLGDAAGALFHARAAALILRELVKLNPSVDVFARDLAVASDRLGDALRTAGDRQGALEWYRAAMERRKQRVAAEPESTEARRDLAISHQRIGDELRASGDMAGALREYRTAFEIVARLDHQASFDPVVRSDLANAHDLIGDVLAAQGLSSGALTEYEAALAIREQLVVMDPSNTDVRFTLNFSHVKRGDILRGRGDAAALESYRAALAVLDELCRIDPTNARWRREILTANDRIGDLLLDLGDAAGALEAFTSCAQAPEPGDSPQSASQRHDRALNLLKTGDALLATNDADAAFRSFEAAAAECERLAGQPSPSVEWEQGLSVARERIGNLLESRGAADEALASYRAAWLIRQRLADSDRSNSSRSRELAVIVVALANALKRRADTDEALRHYRDAHSILDRLLRTVDGSNTVWQADLTSLDVPLGDLLRDRGDAAGATELYESARRLLEGLVRRDPERSDWQQRLTVCRTRAGGMCRDRGDLDGAMREFVAAHEIAQNFAARLPSSDEWKRLLASSHALIGDVHRRRRETERASSELARALALRRDVARRAPDDAELQRDIAITHLRIGDVLQHRGQNVDALAAFQEGRAVIERLVTRDGNNLDWLRDLSIFQERIGDILALLGRPDEGLREHQRRLQLAKAIATHDPSNLKWRRDVSTAHSKVGEVCVALEDYAGALRAYVESRTITEQLASGREDDPMSYDDRLLCHFNIAQLLDILERETEATRERNKCRLLIAAMRQRRLPLTATATQILEQLGDS